MKIILPDFIIIPYQLLEDKSITLIDERLYGILYWFTRMKLEKCVASNTTLAGLVKTTATTIANSLTKLEERGYIKRVFVDKKSRHRLEIIPLVVFSKTLSPTDERVSPTDDTPITHSIKGHSPTDEQKKKSNNKKTKEDTLAKKSNIDILKDETTISELKGLFPNANVLSEIEIMVDWLKSKGRRQVDYVAFARNWIRKSKTAKKLTPIEF